MTCFVAKSQMEIINSLLNNYSFIMCENEQYLYSQADRKNMHEKNPNPSIIIPYTKSFFNLYLYSIRVKKNCQINCLFKKFP